MGAEVPEPAPGEHARVWVRLAGGPLDGDRVVVTGWSAQQRATGAALICDQGTAFGPGGRAWYGPDPSESDPGTSARWTWEGDSA